MNRYNPDIKPPPPTPSAPDTPQAVAADQDDEAIWLAYPEDRRREKESTLRAIRSALAEVTRQELLAAVQAYAAASRNFSRGKVSFSDNWFFDGKWRRYAEDARVRRVARQANSAPGSIEGTAAMLAARLRQGGYLAPNAISTAVAGVILAKGMATEEDLRRAGVRL